MIEIAPEETTTYCGLAHPRRIAVLTPRFRLLAYIAVHPVNRVGKFPSRHCAGQMHPFFNLLAPHAVMRHRPTCNPAQDVCECTPTVQRQIDESVATLDKPITRVFRRTQIVTKKLNGAAP